ncbi:hypothetical protein LPJ53_003965 [Coemansia erecta]|uniref:Uncharacterized protein n=1 Tax=Coemansia erecta TaxID=147472 RepID=A0A9W7XYT2_9FUNG|nr:hypothetical protein LPJ53_003965 [Coemansia erecta]
MDSHSIFSSPPRRPPSNHIVREVSRSGGPGSGNRSRVRRADFRNLSNSARAGRGNEEPWRKRFREQCIDRLNNARDHSVMMRRQLSGMTNSNSGPGMQPQSLYDPMDSSDEDEISEQEMYNIVQQEWARFRADMERDSLQYGALDESILDDIEDDLNYGRSHRSDINTGSDDEQYRQYAEWERFENQMIEEQVIDDELMRVDFDMDDLE